jgi:putative ABC transport system permease protein
MLAHDIRLALRSILRTPWLSLLIVLAIAAGVGAATVLTALRHAMAKDPLPGHSQNLFYVRLDNWRPDVAYPGNGPDPLPPQLAWRDVSGLRNSPIPTHHTGAFEASMTFYPTSGPSERPFSERVRVCHRDFFEMFRVPFAHGSPWDEQFDRTAQPVAVLSATLNERLFGGGNSVGRSFRMHDREFRVVGVLEPWTPTVKYYDFLGDALELPDAAFIPLSLLIPMEIYPTGDTDGWGAPGLPSYESNLMSELLFLQYWVELPTEEARKRYRAYLDAYVLEQQQAGRFPRPVNNRLSSMRDLMAEWNVVPPQATAMQVVGLLFLAVCSLNLIGLLLGKFLARLPEVGIRRALGASRMRIFAQHIVECEIIALVGGALGIVVSLGGLAAINVWVSHQIARVGLFQLDLTVLGAAVGLALIAGLLAGVYPAWRVSAQPAAATLKR